MNSLDKIAHVLETGDNEIHIDEGIRVQALQATQRMLDFADRARQQLIAHTA
ncbi:MAG TPA: quinolinate synthase NadA, partial [Acidiferrobacteraceae bacterium]|nr:quinolinate synthase NadA [Acidiferrobacteraceae bacterium]HEX19316.1 quinolinate synthase NadA [Acidiferrobacteraceae bacterium]